MNRIIQWTLASIGAAICVGEAAVSWQSQTSCPVPALELIELAVLGLTGLVAVALASKGFSSQWGTVAWTVCGGLLALMVITVWSIAPRVLLAALAFCGADILGSRRESRKPLTNLSILGLSAMVNFGLLFALAKDSGIEVVPVPAGSPVTRIFPTADYADAYRARLPAAGQHNIESVTRGVLASLLPCGVKQSRHDRLQAALQDFTFQPGTSLRGWKVYQRATHEIVLGADESHLDFRVSVLVSEEDGVRWVTVSTVVLYNNWKGRAYFLPVHIGHQIILPHAVPTAVHNIR